MVVGLLAFIGVAIPLVAFAVIANTIQQRTKQRAAQSAVSPRPGWQTTTGGPALARRYHRNHPFTGSDVTFETLLYGPLPGGLNAEVFHVVRWSQRGSKASHGTYYTAATVLFPSPLPSVSLHATSDPRDLEPAQAGPGQEYAYTQGSRGPLFAGLRGFATDPRAAAVLFAPDMLARTRALRADWRMDGYALTAVVKEQLPAQAMLALVDNLAWFGSLLPEEVWQTAALQSDPWPGPTPERSA